MLEKMWRKGNTSILTVWMYVGVAPVENSMEVPQKRIIHMIPLLDIYPDKTIIQKGIFTPVFIAALFMMARTRKQP